MKDETINKANEILKSLTYIHNVRLIKSIEKDCFSSRPLTHKEIEIKYKLSKPTAAKIIDLIFKKRIPRNC